MKIYWLLAALLVASPLYADESPPDDSAVPEEAAPADSDAVAQEAPPSEAAPEEAPVEEVASTEAPAEETPAEETTAEEPAQPWKLYVGYAQDNLKLIITDPALKTRFGGQDELKSAMKRIRFGVRLFDVIGVEAQIGQNNQDTIEPRSVETGSYKGIFLVPTGTLFDIMEIAAVFGYAKFDMTRGSVSQDFSGPAYGVNLEFPFKALSEVLPDFRIGGGYMVHSAENNARVSGGHFGVRFDF